jgi:16S rRNA processing protein RimM
VVGRITKPHGIRGEVCVEVRTDFPDERFAVGSTLATDPPAAGPLTIATTRWHTGRLLIRFEQTPDRTAAETLRGLWLTVDVDADTAGPPAGDGEYYDHQLTGLAVVTVGGEPAGTVTDVLHHGQDLLVVTPAPAGPAAVGSAAVGSAGDGSAGDGPAAVGSAAVGSAAARPGEILVPFVDAIVVDVDLAAGKLVIDPPPGLLELAASSPTERASAGAAAAPGGGRGRGSRSRRKGTSSQERARSTEDTSAPRPDRAARSDDAPPSATAAPRGSAPPSATAAPRGSAPPSATAAPRGSAPPSATAVPRDNASSRAGASFPEGASVFPDGASAQGRPVSRPGAPGAMRPGGLGEAGWSGGAGGG